MTAHDASGPRTRWRLGARLLVAVVAAALLWVYVLGPDDENAAATSDGTDGGREVSVATVYASAEEACAAMLGRGATVTRVSAQDAAADKRDISAQVFQRRRSDVTLVSLSDCGGQPVVHVGVVAAIGSTPILDTGERGTPVLVYVQPPIYAF